MAQLAARLLPMLELIEAWVRTAAGSNKDLFIDKRITINSSYQKNTIRLSTKKTSSDLSSTKNRHLDRTYDCKDLVYSGVNFADNDSLPIVNTNRRIRCHVSCCRWS